MRAHLTLVYAQIRSHSPSRSGRPCNQRILIAHEKPATDLGFVNVRDTVCLIVGGFPCMKHDCFDHVLHTIRFDEKNQVNFASVVTELLLSNAMLSSTHL